MEVFIGIAAFTASILFLGFLKWASDNLSRPHSSLNWQEIDDDDFVVVLLRKQDLHRLLRKQRRK